FTRPPDGATNTTERYMNGSYRGMSGRCHNDVEMWAGYYDVEYLANLNDKPYWRGPLQVAPVSLPQIGDGTSNTLLVGERTTRPSGIDEYNRRGTCWADSFNLYSLSAAWSHSVTLLDSYEDCVKAPSEADT